MVYMMMKVVNDEHFKNNNIKLMYDICCQLDKHLRNRDQSHLLGRVDLACPQFHAYAHAADCQVRYGPHHLTGWGLCDGEVMERLWSYLGKFKKMTKEMSSIHRQDILTDALHFYALHQKKTTVTSILHRHKNAVKVQQEALETIAEIQDDYSSAISQEVIQNWLEKEKETLIKTDAPKASFEGHGWIVDYFKLLRKFYALRENLILDESDDSSERRLQKIVKQLVDVEKTHKIPVRWKPTDQPYQNALVADEAASAKSSLDLLRMSGRRRWFLLSLMKKYADGQAQAYRINESHHQRKYKSLQKLLKKFNASVQILKEHGHSLSTLSWEQATNVSSSSLYISAGDKAGHTLVPDAIKRELVDAYALCQRAGEELSTLYQEMSRVIGHLLEECKDMEVALQKMPDISGSLLAGLRSIILRKLDFCQRHLAFAVNSFQPFIEIPVDIQNYLENGNFVISSNQLLNDELDESDAIEDVNSPNSPDLLLTSDEKDDYFFRDDNDSGFLSAGEFSILSSQ